jgi:hypothetical protein
LFHRSFRCLEQADIVIYDPKGLPSGWPDVAAVVQVNRERVTRESCLDLNARLDKTIAALDAAIAKNPPKTPAEQARQKSGRASTITLINALVPHRNCAALVKRVKAH